MDVLCRRDIDGRLPQVTAAPCSSKLAIERRATSEPDPPDLPKSTRAATQVASSVVEDCHVELADVRGVGDQADFEDLPRMIVKPNTRGGRPRVAHAVSHSCSPIGHILWSRSVMTVTTEAGPM